MASLREELEIIMAWLKDNPRESYGEQCARELEMLIRQRMGGDRIYVQPPNSRKDPERAEAIRDAAKKLPTGVAAVRFGVSRQYVQRITKKRNPSGRIG